ncbi:MAG: Complexhybrid Signal Transduction Protein [Phycisphaerales bacterium]|nr:Complexhybrid Signal Transduction Protein [Phycisphaerales bacterium]
MGINVLDASHSASTQPDLLWAWVTLALSSAVALGYGAIAFNWYFQDKVASPQAKAALVRLLLISFACAICGGAFYASDIGWGYLRLCDVVIAALAVYTWSFVLRMRGVSLVDQRLAEMDELEARAERYREIAQLLPHVVWTATSDGRIDFSNQRWFDYAGDSRPWLAAVHPEDRDRVDQWWRDAHQAARAATIEARLCGAGGVCRTFLISATPIVHASGVKWLGACADIEDQKLLAAEREEQARKKNFFLSALSHDLRTPINAVVLHAELLQNSVTEDEVVQSARAITESAAAASELINRLLDFAKVGSLDRNVVAPFSLAAAMRQVHQRYLPLAELHGLYLRLEHPGDVELRTDRHKLERIIGNLIENAIKYTKEGGVTLTVENTAGAVAIRISDTGIGVPRDKAENLFDEFYQVANDERDRRKGFGLGLAICRSLARQIGGEVRLAGTGADGSCFEFTMVVGTPGASAVVAGDHINADRVESLPA